MSAEPAPFSTDVPATISEPSDAELLRRYVDSGTEAAFAELVQRRIGLVYSVALRQTRGDRHRAEEATQAVFTDLARKSRVLVQRPVLAGWLYRSAQFAAANLLRADRRRSIHEREAHMMQKTLGPEASRPDWERVRPMLDRALNELGEADRDAIVLRFFDGRRFADIGAQLRLSENTARMRVERALDRLAAVLSRHGVTSTTSALALALGQQIAGAAPAGLASAVTGAALAGAAATGAAFAVMSLTKFHVGLTAAVTIAGAAAVVMQSHRNAALRRENQRLEKLGADAAPTTRPAPSPTANSNAAQTGRYTITPGPAPEPKDRLPLFSTASDSPQLSRVKELDRLAQKTVEQLNREGNTLVDEFKSLQAAAATAGLSEAAKARAAAAAESKLVAIRAKQREVQAFIESARTFLGEQTQRILAGNAPAADGALDDTVIIRLAHGTAENALATYEKIAGRTVVRDPSLASISGIVEVPAWLCARSDALESLQLALRKQLNIVLEPTASGTLVARAGPPR